MASLVIPDKQTEKLLSMSPGEQVEWIKKSMGVKTFIKPRRCWLDTKSKFLNRTLGSEELGIAYGKSITFAGPFSSGKSLLGYLLCGMAQEDGAQIGIVDIENSLDHQHVKHTCGLNCGKPLPNGGYSKIALFQPEIGVFGGKQKKGMPSPKAVRLQTAEELFKQTEHWMIMQRRLRPEGKVCVMVDSTTAIEPEEELLHELDEQNMRTGLSLPKFLNRLTKRWTQVALNCNAIIIYIAQLRINPQQMFGNPEVIPGGNGILFYPSSINKVRRMKKGLMIQSGTPVGLMSVITNMKNKMGGGSVEGLKCGFKAKFQEYDWKFMSVKKLESELD